MNSKNEISVNDYKAFAFPKKKWMGQKIRPRKNLIRTLDEVFSVFIRLRDSGANGICFCITCGRPFMWKELDCGHIVTRDRKATRYEEKNCHAQCKWCNNHHKGEQATHGIRIDRLYGAGTAEGLIEKGRVRVKLTEEWLMFKIVEYRGKVKELQNSKQSC
jgi:hypothetical protein